MNTSDTLLVIINCHRLVSLLFCLVKHPLLAVGISRSGLIVLLFTVGVENFSAVFFLNGGYTGPSPGTYRENAVFSPVPLL